MATNSQAPAAPAEPGFVPTATAMLFGPEEAGNSIARRPLGGRVLVAVLVVLLVSLATTSLILPHIAEMQREQMRKNPRLEQLPAQQRAELEERMEQMWQHPGMKAFTIGMGGLTGLVGIVVIATLLYAAQAVMGGRATYAGVLSVTAFASLITFVLGGLVMTGLVLAKGSMEGVSTGLGALLPDRPPSDPLRAILDAVDVFYLWAAIAAGIALAPVSRLGRGAALGSSLAVYLLVVTIKTVFRIFYGGA